MLGYPGRKGNGRKGNASFSLKRQLWRFLQSRRSLLLVLFVGGGLLFNFISLSLLSLPKQAKPVSAEVFDRSWSHYETAYLQVRHAHQTWGCVERPHVGRVKAIGSQPDCPGAQGNTAASKPNKIAKIIHQTYKTLDLPDGLRTLSETWILRNPGWEVRHYSDADCLAIVKSEFPQYLDAYANLPKPVERADFFRYLVVLRYGGVYADMDTECRVPLDSYISTEDTLVAGWENEFPSVPMAVKRDYSRKSQLLQWMFAGAAGHPALVAVCDHINANAQATFSGNTNTDTLDRTGPGAWTDAVLGYTMSEAKKGRAAAQQWPVRLLPRVSFGAFGVDGLPSESPGALVLHHFRGSWKARQNCHRWGKFFFLPRMLGSWVRGEGFHKPKVRADHLLRPGEARPDWWRDLYIPHISGFMWSVDFFRWHSRAQHDACMVRLSEHIPLEVADLELQQDSLQKVSVAWSPPFDMVVHQVGVEALLRADGDDVSAHLTALGLWQAGWYPQRAQPPTLRGPTVQQALLSVIYGDEPPGSGSAVASVRATVSQPVPRLSAPGLLVDVGAGLGLFSLAAAAKGMQALAIEHEEALSELMKQSIGLNGWQETVSVSDAVIGGEDGLKGCARLGLGLPTASREPGALPDFDNDERRWRHGERPVASWSPGSRCASGQQRPMSSSRLDNVVRSFLEQRGVQRDGGSVESVVLRVADTGRDAHDILSGAEELLAGTLSPQLAAPSAILLEAQMSDLHKVALLIRLLEERYGFTGGAFHRGANCNPPEGRGSGETWCRCATGEFTQRALEAAPSAQTAPLRNDEKLQPEPSFNVVLLHDSEHARPEGAKWEERITRGSASCMLQAKPLAGKDSV